MLRVKDVGASTSRGASRCGVQIGLSFPFLDSPPYHVLRGEIPFAELLDGGPGRPNAGAGADPPGGSRADLAEALPRHLPGAAPARLHVGSDTCERLLPSPRSLGAWIAAAGGAGWAVSLVLPPLGRDGQARAWECVRAVEKEPGAEVVANDWGTVHFLRSRHPDLRIVLGRLTHKVLRDPRVADLFDSPKAPMGARSALCRSGELAPGYRMLMERYRIGRREIDPFLQPLEEEEWEGRGERLSVHLPYQFVTMGRGCLLAAMHGPGKGKFVPGASCRAECARYAVEFRIPLPDGNGAGRSLLALGNAFYHEVPTHVAGRVLSRISSGGRADRIVVTVMSAGRKPS